MNWSYENNLVIPNDDFNKNAAIDISKYVKKMQGLDYLPWAVSMSLLRNYKSALDVGFECNSEGHPYFETSKGVYLMPYLFDRTTGKRTPARMFPVRDNRRKADADVMLDTIGNQTQRAYAKCIAQETGIGWSLYSRLPDESIEELETASEPVSFVAKRRAITSNGQLH